MLKRFIFVFLIVGSSCLNVAKAADRTTDWIIPQGASLKISSSGFSFPTDIRFAPKGASVDYFVLELRGKIKTVGRDGKVRVFAVMPTVQPKNELPDSDGETGAVGLCLDEKRNWIYLTGTYSEGGVLRNQIVRIKLERDFSKDKTQVAESARIPFYKYPAAESHQIGKCVVSGDYLYVGVGDGYRPNLARDVSSSLGKILRIPLHETKGASSFKSFSSSANIEPYVFARGLRNPFALGAIRGELLAADNGMEVDRLIHVTQGSDWLWEGKDDIFPLNTIFFWRKSVGPAGMSITQLEDGTSTMIIAQGGDPAELPPSKNGRVTLKMFRPQCNPALNRSPDHYCSISRGLPTVVGSGGLT